MATDLWEGRATRAGRGGPMLYVSLLIELLRSNPSLLFWTATLSQALLWLLVPTLFYAAPPGDLPIVVAVGHQWPFGSAFGPPLANWLAEIAYDAAGHRTVGIYLLVQICVVVTYWAVFALGRSLVGAQHAVMAVLLMVGIAAFSVPTPDFGPSILAMPLTALALLHYWRAVGEGRPHFWLALGIDLGLLLMTTYAGLITVGLIALFTILTPRARAMLGSVEPWIAGIILVLIVFPHLIWLDRSGVVTGPDFSAPLKMLLSEGRVIAWVRLIGELLVLHAALIILAGIAGGVGITSREFAPSFERAPLQPLAKRYVYLFALAPAFVATLLGVLLDRSVPVGGAAPLVVLSGLAIIVAAGDVIHLYRQRIVGLVWGVLLLAPPAVTAIGVVVLPWTLAIDLAVDRPMAQMGQFFTDSFRHRTGKPLPIVVGDAQIAPLVALASSDRPSLYLEASPGLTPWVTDADVRSKGGVVLWLVTDPAGAPPASIKTRFPELVAEVPRSFERPIQGLLPLFRVGWAVVRGQGQGESSPEH